MFLLDVVLGDVLQLQVLGVVVVVAVAPGGLGALAPAGVPMRQGLARFGLVGALKLVLGGAVGAVGRVVLVGVRLVAKAVVSCGRETRSCVSQR